MKYIVLLIFIMLSSFNLAHANDNDITGNKQVLCVAENIYWEARNQSVRGMMAVGLVTMNRVHDSRFPDTPCEVVKQGPTRPSWKDPTKLYPVKNRCQFSWYCDGKSDDIPIYDHEVWSYSLAMAVKVVIGYFPDLTHGATHYHADYVTPGWAKSKTRTIKIGTHIFYRWKKR